MINTRVHEKRLLVAAVLLSMAVALAFAPDAYLPMLARSFIVQWPLFFLAAAAWAFWRRAWLVLSASLFCIVLLLPQQIMVEEVWAGRAGGPVLRVAHMNVLQPNTQFASAINSVQSADADLISVQEVSSEWASALKRAFAGTHPFHHIVPRTNCYGIALFSKHPFARVRTIMESGAPFIEAELDIAGERIRVFAVHATSPGSYVHYRMRNAQLKALAERIQGDPRPTLVIGDLNTVHWDGAYQRFCARSGMRPINSPAHRTWPSVGPIALIPLDHALVGFGLTPARVSTFDVSGSDHRGLLAEIHLPHAR